MVVSTNTFRNMLGSLIGGAIFLSSVKFPKEIMCNALLINRKDSYEVMKLSSYQFAFQIDCALKE